MACLSPPVRQAGDASATATLGAGMTATDHSSRFASMTAPATVKTGGSDGLADSNPGAVRFSGVALQRNQVKLAHA